ncbi:L,D-transpeptidase family protein [Mucilaginibacter ginkgonis]|uniref:L,D-transpeptidase family protein n=1 Tax=Mucilaginibacter ginkgonis TaxID=2682091 RepID=A0A6I4I2F7_9SPHI|nr:L,D-transpeptidase family protein [Mucilaginibacter ginkgonis]QQL50492.1 L,D-transpeptidase family protein [Mucilaginibacter ginkgonis]
MRKQYTLTLLAITCAFLFTLQSCKKSRSEMGKELYQKTKNKVFKNVTPEGFLPVFQQELEAEKSTLSNPKLIAAFYEQHDYDPIFVMDHLKTDDLKLFAGYLEHANSHGINPEYFNAQEYSSLLNKFYDKKGIKTTDEAYHDMAKLEVMTANLLIAYSDALQYGLVNPKQLFQRYYIATARPDSAFHNRVLAVSNFKTYLDSIQPKNPQYLALQKALADSSTGAGTLEQTKRVIAVNMERLRWKNKPNADKYVFVNVPDFRLDVIENGKSTLNMKVCVGQGRNKDYTKSLISYQDTDKSDRPFSRETPLLNSMIYEAQVNPIWNIPQSIVSKEIVKHAQDDPNYLDNSHIDVYHHGKKLDDTEDINWGSADLSDYEFKQQPGEDNSLGKVKFLFPNKSSVYLHDTPAQKPFGYDMRAVSHGCVRLEKPLDFAHAIFGDGSKYNLIAKYMGEDKPEPTDISLPKKVPVYINYITCWSDESGTIQYRKDVYGLDIVLYSHLKKYLTA